MRLTTPRFWYSEPSLWSALLLPLSWLYAILHLIHQRLGKPYISTLPVLCIGNLVAGGGGKTPAALAIADMIKRNDPASRPVFLTRGYGGGLRGPVMVDPSIHTAADVGDEPLLLARMAPTIVAADRAAGARLAEQNGAGIIIMDDGLHNTGLTKTLKLVVIDGAAGFGNGRMLPAGPLRTPLKDGLALADAFILIGQDKSNIRSLLGDWPVFEAQIEPSATVPDNQDYIAFTGIARPEKFFETLTQAGLKIVERRAYPDHHIFSTDELSSLKNAAAEKNAFFITTEKDFIRLPDFFKAKSKVEFLPIRLSFKNEKQVFNFIKEKHS